MFDVWSYIDDNGIEALRSHAAEVTPLEWCEIGEKYPDAMPAEFANYNVLGDPRVIRESPFGLWGADKELTVVSDSYSFKVADKALGATLWTSIDLPRMVSLINAKDYRGDSSEGCLTCECSVPGCAGIWSQRLHISRDLAHWSVRKDRDRFELFFERDAYETGIVRMLHDMLTTHRYWDTVEMCSYPSFEDFQNAVIDAGDAHPYFWEIWDEVCGDNPVKLERFPDYDCEDEV